MAAPMDSLNPSMSFDVPPVPPSFANSPNDADRRYGGSVRGGTFPPPSHAAPPARQPAATLSTTASMANMSAAVAAQSFATGGADGGAATAGPDALSNAHAAAIEEVLDFEVVIDMNRLRELATTSMPPYLRPKCYPLLLGVAPIDKTQEMTTMRHLEDTFNSLVGPKREEDPSRGRRLKRFLGSALGRRLHPTLRAELIALASLPPPSASSSASAATGGGGAGGGLTSSAAGGLASHAASSTGAALALGTNAPAAVPSNKGERSAQGNQRVKQLVAVEAMLAVHVAELPAFGTYARGVSALLPPVEVTYLSSTSQQYCDEPGDGEAGGGVGVRLLGRRELEGLHFSTPHLEDPFTWHIQFSLILGSAMDTGQDAFFAAESLHTTLAAPRGLWSHAGLRDAYSFFIMLLHHCEEDIYRHLHELGVNNLRWAPALLGSLFCDRMPRERVLEVWDHYVSTWDFSLHPYVCAALLEFWLERVLDMEGDDFIHFVAGPWEEELLPATATLIRAAEKIREDAKARKLL
jgi:hypothetical protein